MWNAVDRKDGSELTGQKEVKESQIKIYFTDIFQSKKVATKPTVSDVIETLNSYDSYVALLDDTPNIDELNIAFKSIKHGASTTSSQRRDSNAYSNHFLWELCSRGLQILHALRKPGHTYEIPQVYGTALTLLLCRVYDRIIDNRFIVRYKPNPEQSEFRALQGCILALFVLIILIV